MKFQVWVENENLKYLANTWGEGAGGMNSVALTEAIIFKQIFSFVLSETDSTGKSGLRLL